MEARHLDMVMVPMGLLLQGGYHCWLLFTILNYPDRTVIGLNAQVKRRWVQIMMTDSRSNGVLAVQTIRNNIMASTVLATTAITLASLIAVFVSASTAASSSIFVYGNTSAAAHSVKYFVISLCFLLAFLCNVQSIRYYAHVSFLVTSASAAAAAEGAAAAADVTAEYVARSLNRGSYFWSLGLRAFYVSFTLFLWIFGPIPMLASSVVMCCLLYFLDTTTEITRGALRGFDQATDIILDESHERVYSTKEGVQQLAFELYIIRVDNISVVGELDEELDAKLDLSKLRAHPLKQANMYP